MAEYIEREKVIERLESSINSWGKDCNSNAPVMVRAYQDVLSRVKNIPTADVVEVKWISVKDELPKEKERVLVFLKNNGHTKGYTRIDTDRLIKGNWIRWGSCVTHWMPLPEAPKGDADNG